MRRVLKWLLRISASLALIGVVLYFFGLRVVMDGGGGLHLQFVRSADAQADAIDAHRSAQRAAAPAPPPAAVTTTAPASIPDPASAPWPQFRGPDRDGRIGAAINTDWPPSGLTPMWKQPIGGGYASFAVAGGRAYTIEQRRDEEVVAAYDVRTGRELWTQKWRARFTETMGGDGPRATPTWHDGRVYALGATGELAALDAATGRALWRTNILRDAGASNLQWGMAASPLIVGDTVVVLPGGSNGRSIVAYDRVTGERRWSAQNDGQAYASPMSVVLAGTRQLLIVASSRIMGVTADRGELLWAYPWQTMSDINAAQPIIFLDDRLYISSGYGVGAAMLQVAKGDDGKFAVKELWRNTRMKNRFASAVLVNGHIYGFDESIFACIDAATGDLAWKGGRYGYGQVLAVGDHLIVLTEEGDLALLRATPERHDELARFPAISGKTWNHPALADGILLVRNATEMAAFNLRRK
jgi:outer membrane protein assembly factor BamB